MADKSSYNPRGDDDVEKGYKDHQEIMKNKKKEEEEKKNFPGVDKSNSTTPSQGKNQTTSNE
jgi:hypothetical protein